MGAVFRPKDLGRGNRKIIEHAVRDFSPDTKDSVIKLLNSWEGKISGKKLTQLLGQEKAQPPSLGIGRNGGLGSPHAVVLRD